MFDYRTNVFLQSWFYRQKQELTFQLSAPLETFSPVFIPSNARYDPLGIRIRKIDPNAGETTLYYYNNNWQVLCEYDDSGNSQRFFVYGNYIDEVLFIYNFGPPVTYLWYVHDHLYSPVAFLSASMGLVKERYEYDAYGNPTILDTQYAPRNTSLYGNPYFFTGRRVDFLDDGNLRLQYNRNRYYDYYTGRWLQAEKRGMIPNDSVINLFCPRCQYEDGMSLYEYAGSNPVIRLDHWGLSWCTLDFVHHYFGLGFIGGIWLWPGDPVDLTAVGLLDAFKSAPSVVAAVDDFKSIIDHAIWLEKISLNNCPVIATISGSDFTETNVTWEPCLFAVGHSTFFRKLHCTLFPDPVDHCQWGHTCTLTFWIDDEFADPLDMGFELPGGTTYPITASWSETYP